MIEKKLTEEVVPLTTGRMLKADDLTLIEQVQAHEFLGFVVKRIEERAKVIRDNLLAAAKDGGDESDKGAFKIMVDGSEVVNERRKAKLPDENQFKTLLAEKGIPIEKAFSPKTELVYDPSKVDDLISKGKLNKESVEKLCKETRALRVNPSDEIQAVIEMLTTAFVGKKMLAEGEKSEPKKKGKK